MTRPIRNTGPCFPLGLPRQRGQRDVLSHTEFYTPIFCMLSVFQAIPFKLPRKPPTVNKWDSTLGTPGRGQVLQSISSPNVKCAPETTARSLRGDACCYFYLFIYKNCIRINNFPPCTQILEVCT